MTRRWGLSWLAGVWVAAACSAGTAGQLVSNCLDSSQAPLLTISSRQAVKLLISQPKPHYPPAARVNYIHGRVRLLVTIDCQGRVDAVHVVKGHPFLAQAAIEAIRRWVYRPYLDASGPLPFQTTVDVNFNLRSSILRHFPPRPDQDLVRAVRPPKLISTLSQRVVGKSPRLRMLVSSKGRVIDSTLLDGTADEYRKAAVVVTHWKFIPAQCDNLAVPWYVEMAVPVPASAAKPVALGLNGWDRASARGVAPPGQI